MPKSRALPTRKTRLDDGKLIERLDQAFSVGDYALVIRQCERLADAQSRSFEISIRWGTALRLAGNPEASAMKLEQVRERINFAEQLESKRVACLNELSRSYFELERYDEASRILISLTETGSEEVNEGLFANLVLVLEADGRREAAVEQLAIGVQRFPNSLTLWEKLAELQRQSERWEEAEVAYRRCRMLAPKNTIYCRRLITVYRHLKSLESEKLALEEWLELDPDNAVAKHMLAALDSSSPSGTPSRPDEKYIKQVFDEFSDTFDEQLHSLGYSAPKTIAEEIERRIGSQEGSFEILDVGCGTGLMAEFLRPYASHLIGIDLSERMLAKAESRQYDELQCVEMVEFMSAQSKRFDLIVSADTFNYVGDLAHVIGAAFAALRPGSMLIFSVEKHAGNMPRCGYTLNPNGRYSHSKEYVEQTLRDAGFTSVECHDAKFREEAGNPVEGCFWSAIATEETAG
ncbi:MAG: methyltransferase domain-containing protein [Planctomycetota bacterium]